MNEELENNNENENVDLAELFSDIATSIRAKKGDSEGVAPVSMSEAISDIKGEEEAFNEYFVIKPSSIPTQLNPSQTANKETQWLVANYIKGGALPPVTIPDNCHSLKWIACWWKLQQVPSLIFHNNITDMSFMCANSSSTGASAQTVMDTSGWDTSNVTTWQGAFAYTKFPTFDFTGLNLGKLQSMYYCFYQTQLQSITPASPVFGALNTMECAFYNNSKLTGTLDLSSWTSSVPLKVSFQGAFSSNPNLTTIKAPHFTLLSAPQGGNSGCHFGTCFSGCSAATTIDLGSLDFGSVYGGYTSNTDRMFLGCTSLVNLTFGTNLGAGYNRYSEASYVKLDLSPCTQLSHDSLMDVINKLADVTEYVEAYPAKPAMLILGSTNLNKLTEEEKAIVTTKGWDLS